MAIIPKNEFIGRTIADDPDYPQGKATNVVNNVVGTGTPLEAKWVNDDWGFKQALLDEAGITPSGLEDKVGTSDYLDSLKRVAKNKSNSITLAEAIADSSAKEGDTVTISDRGDGLFEYKTGYVNNTFNVVACTGVFGLSLVLVVGDSINVVMCGAVTGAGDQSGAIQAAIDTGVTEVVIDLEVESAQITLTSNQRVVGSGKLIGVGASTPNDLLVVVENISNSQFHVDIDCGQSESTTAVDNKYRYGLFISNVQRGVFMTDKVISGIKVGFPIYITGTSVNGADPDSTVLGSKNIAFTRTRVDAHPTDDADGGDTSEITIRSDFFAGDGGGTYFGASNGVRLTDYTIDASVTYPATTQNITFTDCEFINCDRVGVLNAKYVYLNGNKLKRFGYRGYNCAPTCEHVHISGGTIDGAFGASINFSYASRVCSAKGVQVNGQKFNSNFSGYSEGTTIRVLYGTEDVNISNIHGMGGKERQVWIMAAKNINLDDIDLTSHNDGGSLRGFVVSGSFGGNTATYTTTDITLRDSSIRAIDALYINEYTGTADMASDSIRVYDTELTAVDYLMRADFLNAPTLQDKVSLRNVTFKGQAARFLNFDRAYLHIDAGNTYGFEMDTSYTPSYSIDFNTAPDSLPIGHKVITVNGLTGQPVGAANQGILHSHKYETGVGFRKFIRQEYHEVTQGSDFHQQRFWMRWGKDTTDDYTAWVAFTAP